MPKAAAKVKAHKVPKGKRQQWGAQILQSSEHLHSGLDHHAHFAAQDKTRSSYTWRDFQPTLELVTSFRTMLGETPLNFPFQSESLHQPCSSQLLESKQVFAPGQCRAAPWLEAVLYTPWTIHWDFHPGLQFSSIWKPNNLEFSFFSSSVAMCVLDQMELLRLVVIVILLTPLVGMRGWAQSVWLWHWQISYCSQGFAQMLQRWTIWAAPALEAINRNF